MSISCWLADLCRYAESCLAQDKRIRAIVEFKHPKKNNVGILPFVDGFYVCPAPSIIRCDGRDQELAHTVEACVCNPSRRGLVDRVQCRCRMCRD